MRNFQLNDQVDTEACPIKKLLDHKVQQKLLIAGPESDTK
jgi:hypothetical protein